MSRAQGMVDLLIRCYRAQGFIRSNALRRLSYSSDVESPVAGGDTAQVHYLRGGIAVSWTVPSGSMH